MPRDPGTCWGCRTLWDGGGGVNLTGGDELQVCFGCWLKFPPEFRVKLTAECRVSAHQADAIGLLANTLSRFEGPAEQVQHSLQMIQYLIGQNLPDD